LPFVDPATTPALTLASAHSLNTLAEHLVLKVLFTNTGGLAAATLADAPEPLQAAVASTVGLATAASANAAAEIVFFIMIS